MMELVRIKAQTKEQYYNRIIEKKIESVAEDAMREITYSIHDEMGENGYSPKYCFALFIYNTTHLTKDQVYLTSLKNLEGTFNDGSIQLVIKKVIKILENDGWRVKTEEAQKEDCINDNKEMKDQVMALVLEQG